MKPASPKNPKLPPESWVALLGADPRPWLLESGEATARWIVFTQLLDAPDSAVQAAHKAVLADLGTQELIARLPDWSTDAGASGHNSPLFVPNLLQLLAEMGLGCGDSPRVEQVLDSMLEHQEANGRFQAFGKAPGSDQPYWGSLLCDTHAITEVMVRFGRTDDPRVKAALNRMEADLSSTTQGTAWPCIPDLVTGFRGPGRKADFCPMVTLEALRTFSRLPEPQRTQGLVEVARVLLRAWRVRGSEKPYMFGFGLRYKTVKWPPFWFDLHWMLDTLGRFPELWRGKNALLEDRRALAEMVACLVAYNFDSGGRVTPHSCYKGFEQFSFGQKKQPSPFATARLAAVLRRFNDLTDEIRAVDVDRLESSRGGTGRPMPPKRAAR
ncbi:MAG: hypothetical protein N2318_09010 [Meiothermus sp.]|nr:hypothetical protein [Meiothermus sp.]